MFKLNDCIVEKLQSMGYNNPESQLFFFALDVARTTRTDPFELIDYFLGERDKLLLTKEFLEYNGEWQLKSKYANNTVSKNSKLILKELKQRLSDNGHPENPKSFSIWSTDKKLISLLDKYDLDTDKAINVIVEYYKNTKYATKLETYLDSAFEAGYNNYQDNVSNLL